MIIFLILITSSHDNVWISLGENWCWSLLGLKGCICRMRPKVIINQYYDLDFLHYSLNYAAFKVFLLILLSLEKDCSMSFVKQRKLAGVRLKFLWRLVWLKFRGCCCTRRDSGERKVCLGNISAYNGKWWMCSISLKSPGRGDRLLVLELLKRSLK